MPDPRNRLQWKATCKVYPAIADLQAVSGFVRVYEKIDNVGVAIYDHDIYTVPAGKIFRLEFIQAYAWQGDPTKIYFILSSGGVDYSFYSSAYGVALEIHKQFEYVLYNENEIVRIEWIDCLATNDVTGMIFGTLYDRY